MQEKELLPLTRYQTLMVKDMFDNKVARLTLHKIGFDMDLYPLYFEYKSVSESIYIEGNKERAIYFITKDQLKDHL